MTDPTQAARVAAGSTGERGLDAAARAITGACEAWRQGAGSVLVIGIDGHGASGKSTIARRVAAAIEVALVSGDDFFADGGAGDLAAYYDWPRLRREALEPLRAGQVARFISSDPFVAGRAGSVVTIEPATVVVLEGVGAGAMQIDDLVDRAVLVDTPAQERVARLRERVDPHEWDDHWLEAERRYFESRPRSSFDLIVAGADETAGHGAGAPA